VVEPVHRNPYIYNAAPFGTDVGDEFLINYYGLGGAAIPNYNGRQMVERYRNTGELANAAQEAFAYGGMNYDRVSVVEYTRYFV
jgi:hypothetical protein